MFAKQLAACKIDRPVFITAIPRAGTTLLLECWKLPEFASHCYRDMPFVLIPCLWNRFSARFRQAGQLQEAPRRRDAHRFRQPRGDGGSAVEDFLAAALPQRSICPGGMTRRTPSSRLFSAATCARSSSCAAEGRGRRALRVEKQPQYRPHGHAPPALSRFGHSGSVSGTAATCRFTGGAAPQLPPDPQGGPVCLRYMRAIGHYDFGENLRPVDFDGWFDSRESKETGPWPSGWSTGW